MIRFEIPSSEYERGERIKQMDDQLENFLNSDGFHRYLEILGICYSRSRKRLLEELRKFDTRNKGNGQAAEAQYARTLETLEDNKDELFHIFEELGWISINETIMDNPDHLLILGGSFSATYDRTAAAKRYYGSSLKSINALSCYRPISPNEITKAKENGLLKTFNSNKETEFGVFYDAFVDLFDLGKAVFNDAFVSDRNLNKLNNVRTILGSDGKLYRIYASPASENNSRPSTYDTYIHFLKDNNQEEDMKLLALTNNRYCNMQALQLGCAVIQMSQVNHRIDADVVGISTGSDLATIKEYSPSQYSNDVIGLVDWIVKFKEAFVW